VDGIDELQPAPHVQARLNESGGGYDDRAHRGK
jgi:hypothetical protein